jgi:3-hydroxy acid dehydrogenase / malonic semialdehyde reductase
VLPQLIQEWSVQKFNLVRLNGDHEKADAIYEGMQPLTAEDVADCVLFAATRPSYVNIDAMIIKPLDQVTAYQVHRRNKNK